MAELHRHFPRQGGGLLAALAAVLLFFFAFPTLEAEEKKFENGLSTSYNVLLMQEDLVEQQFEYGRALLDFKKAEYGLEAAKGTLLEYVGVELAPGPGDE